MGTITTGVEFDTIAREWRCKWSEDNDKAALAQAQAELNKVLEAVKAVDGVKGVQVRAFFFVLMDAVVYLIFQRSIHLMQMGFLPNIFTTFQLYSASFAEDVTVRIC